MAFQQLISGATAGLRTLYGYPTLVLTAQGVFPEGLDAFGPARRPYVHDSEDLGGAIDFALVDSYGRKVAYANFNFGSGDILIRFAGLESARIGFAEVRNLAFNPWIAGLASLEMGPPRVYRAGEGGAVNFTFTSEYSWSPQPANTPFHFGATDEQYVFPTGWGSFNPSQFSEVVNTAQFIFALALSPYSDTSLYSRKLVQHAPAPSFEFVDDYPVELRPPVAFHFGRAAGVQTTLYVSSLRPDGLGYPVLRLLAFAPSPSGIDSAVFGVPRVAAVVSGRNPGYGLDFNFLYGNTRYPSALNAGFYFYSEKDIGFETFGPALTQFGTLTMVPENADVYPTGWESLETGSPKLSNLVAYPSGWESLALGAPEVYKEYQAIFPSGFSALGIDGPEKLWFVMRLEADGQDHVLLGAPWVFNRHQFVSLFTGLFGSFGSATVSKQQYLGFYGSRATQYGTAYVANSVDLGVAVSGFESSTVGLNTEVWLQDQVLNMSNASLPPMTEYGEFAVDHLVPQLVEFEGQTDLIFVEISEGALVAHSVRYLDFSDRGLDSLDMGDVDPYLKSRWVAPDWMVCTYYGEPEVVRWLEVTPDGYTLTEFGGDLLLDFSGVVFAPGIGSFESPPGGSIRLGQKFITFNEFQPLTEFSPFDAVYLRRYINIIDEYEDSPPPFKGSEDMYVKNYDQQVWIPGFLSFDSKPYLNLVELAGRPVLFDGQGLDLLEIPKKHLVAHDVRYVAPEAFEDSYIHPLGSAVYNAAFGVYPESIAPSAIPLIDNVESNLQWFNYSTEGVDELGVGGASMVSDAVRTITQLPRDEPMTGVGDVYVGLAEMFIEPQGFLSFKPEKFEIIGPFFTTIAPHPAVFPEYSAEFFGEAAVRNVDRYVYMAPAFDSIYIEAWPTIDLWIRSVAPEGFDSFTLPYDKFWATHAERELPIPGMLLFQGPNRWSVRNVNPPPPGLQTVEFARLAEYDTGNNDPWFPVTYGTTSIKENRIDFNTAPASDAWPDAVFGAPNLLCHTIEIRQSWYHTEYGVPRTDDGHQTINMDSGYDGNPEHVFLQMGKPRMSPNYIFMLNSDFEAAVYENQDVKDGRWKPLDETGPYDGYTTGHRPGGFGAPIRISHLVRYIEMVGMPSWYGLPYGRWSDPRVYNKTIRVEMEGISTFTKGWITILPHTIRVLPQGIASLGFGEWAVDQEVVDLDYDQSFTVTGFDSFAPGALDPQKWIREIYPTPWTDTAPTDYKHPMFFTKAFGNNNPMVYHYPRGFTFPDDFTPDVDEMTEWGTTWVSNEIRYLEMDSDTPWQEYYDDGMIWTDFRWRMTVKNATDGEPAADADSIGPPGPMTQVIGTPSVRLAQQRIGVYMIAPPCVIGAGSVAHG